MKIQNEITQDLLKELFDYRGGNLYWKVKKGCRINIGDLAGTVGERGYQQIGINGKVYLAHRLIFLYHHGYLPQFLDHIDGDRSNNYISNLREVTHQGNQHNQKKREFYGGKPTSSIYKGVSWNKGHKKWCSMIMIDGKNKHLGYFISETKAADVYNKSAVEVFGSFANLNVI